MIDTPQINHIPENAIPDDESRPLPRMTPKLETPVIQSQDLEHQPREATRVTNKGVKITPTFDAKADEEALEAMEEIEKQYREQMPG